MERIAGWVVEGRQARSESIRGRRAIAWASCSPRPVGGAGSIARKLKGLFMVAKEEGRKRGRGGDRGVRGKRTCERFDLGRALVQKVDKQGAAPKGKARNGKEYRGKRDGEARRRGREFGS